MIRVDPPGADLAVIRRDALVAARPARGTILFIHGLGDAASMFGPSMEAAPLAPYGLALVDLLGHGLSDKPTSFDYSPASHAAVLFAALRQLNLPPPLHLVGFSLGAAVAVELSRFGAIQVGSLVLCEPVVDLNRMEFARRIVAMPEGAFADDYGELLQQYTGPDSTEADRRWAETAAFAGSRAFYRCARGLLAAAERGELTAHLRESKAPKTFILSPQTYDQWPMARTFKQEGARVVLIDSRSKMPMYESPDAFYDAVAAAISAGVTPTA
jgi:pimeloyl-ACP methyl ester carboxylesterase